MSMPPFLDVKNLTEDQRIDLIGRSIMEIVPADPDKPIMIGFMVEDQIKADRYIEKIKRKFPAVRVVDIIQNCPDKGLITVRLTREDA